MESSPLTIMVMLKAEFDMLKVQAARLDYDYLNHWARELALTDLLAQAYDDAGIAAM